jgi:hypothetical protein
MKQALEMALDWIKKQPEETPHTKYDVDTRYVVLKELEAALAQPEQHTLTSRVNDVRFHKERDEQRAEAMRMLAQPEQKPMAKLQVTLEDRPIDIELAQYKRMFEAACSELGAINEALGLDPNDGGAEPILFAIEQLRGEPQEPVAWMVYTLDGQSVCVTDNPTDFTPEHRALPLYTTPPQRKPLTDEQIQKCYETTGHYQTLRPQDKFAVFALARAIEAAHGIKE